MTDIVLRNMSEYPQVLRRIFQQGERRSPRGLATFDLGFTSIVLLNPQAGGMPLAIGRKLNPAIGAVEAIQLIAGVSDPQLVLRLAPQFERYSDTAEDGTGDRMFWGAYGARIRLQAVQAVRKLRLDVNSRQAVITLWDPWMDNIEDKHDYPCTIALQFHMNRGLLDMNTIMRSNDAWLGLPYDVFQFTQLQATMARALNTTPGLYRHTALSLHLYERDCPAASDLIDAYTPQDARMKFTTAWQPQGIGRSGNSMHGVIARARRLIDNAELTNETESEKWYRDLLHPQSPNVG